MAQTNEQTLRNFTLQGSQPALNNRSQPTEISHNTVWQVTFHPEEPIFNNSVEVKRHKEDENSTPSPISFNDLHYPRARLQVLSAMLSEKQAKLDTKQEFEAFKQCIIKKKAMEEMALETQRKAETKPSAEPGLVLTEQKHVAEGILIEDELFDNPETDVKKLQELEYYRHFMHRKDSHRNRSKEPNDIQAQMCERLSWTLARFPYYEKQKKKEIFALYLHDFKTHYKYKTLFLDFSNFIGSDKIDLYESKYDYDFSIELVSIRFLEKILLQTPSIMNVKVKYAWQGDSGNEAQYLLTLESLKAFLKIFNNPDRNFETLDLSKESIFLLEESFKVLCDFVSETRSISSLNLSEIGTPGHYDRSAEDLNVKEWRKKYELLFIALQKNEVIEELIFCRYRDFASNYIKGISALGEFIKKTKTLKKLKLELLFPLEISSILEALAWNRSIEHVFLTPYYEKSTFCVKKDRLLELLNIRHSYEPTNLYRPKDFVSLWRRNYTPQEAADILIERNKILAAKSKYLIRAAFVMGLYEHEIPRNKKKSNGERLIKDEQGNVKPLQVCSNLPTSFSKDTLNLLFQFADLTDAPKNEVIAQRKQKKSVT